MKAQAHIQAWLRAQGRKKSWLAEQVAVSPSTMSRWMKGKQTPTQQARIILSGIIGVSLHSEGDWK